MNDGDSVSVEELVTHAQIVTWGLRVIGKIVTLGYCLWRHSMCKYLWNGCCYKSNHVLLF